MLEAEADVGNLAVELLALAVYGPLLVLLHELGHAAFAGLGGYRVTSFGVGMGKPFARMHFRGGLVIHLDRWLFAGGACNAIPIGPPTGRRAWFHAGGLIVQGVLAVALLLVPQVWWVDRIEQFNLLVAATNALPWRFGGMASDGWYLLDAFLGGRKGGEVLPQRRILDRLAAREQTIGSPLGTVYAALCLAWVDVLAGRPRDASDFFAKDPPETTLDPWVDALYHYVHAEWHRVQSRALAAVRTARETRAALGGSLVDEAAGLLAIAEARALVDLGAPAQAQRALARVAGLAGPVGRQAAVVLLGASLDAEPDDLEFCTWKVVRLVHEAWLDPADASTVLWEAADRLEEQQRVNAARGARDAARLLARRTLRNASSEDRPSLLRRLGDPAGRRPLGSLTGSV